MKKILLLKVLILLCFASFGQSPWTIYKNRVDVQIGTKTAAHSIRQDTVAAMFKTLADLDSIYCSGGGGTVDTTYLHLLGINAVDSVKRRGVTDTFDYYVQTTRHFAFALNDYAHKDTLSQYYTITQTDPHWAKGDTARIDTMTSVTITGGTTKTITIKFHHSAPIIATWNDTTKKYYGDGNTIGVSDSVFYIDSLHNGLTRSQALALFSTVGSVIYNGSHNYIDTLRISTTGQVIEQLINGHVMMLIDSNNNFRFYNKAFIADPDVIIQSTYDTSRFFYCFGDANIWVAGRKGFVFGTNNYYSAIGNGADNFIWGEQNTLKTIAASSYNFLKGRRNALGDSTGQCLYDFMNGYGNTAYNNSFNLYYRQIYGRGNIVFLKSNSGVPGAIVGSDNIDTSDADGENFASSFFGSSWVNRHKGTFFMGYPGSGRVTLGYTSMQDYETVIGSLGRIRFFPNNLRGVGIISTLGNWIVGDTTDAGGYKLRVHGSELIDISLVVTKDLTISSLPNPTGTKMLGTDANGKVIQIPIDTFRGNTMVTSRTFGIPADFRRTWMRMSHDTIYAASGTFITTDVNKVFVVHKTRTFFPYTVDTESITTKGKVYVSSSIMTTDSTSTVYNVVDSIAYFGTNIYDTLQGALNWCASNGIGTFWFDAGTYLLCPKLSSVANAQSPLVRGLQVNNSVSVRGAAREATYLKWSVEDDDHIDSTERYAWAAWTHNSGDFHFWDITMLSPDRYTHDKAKFFGTAIQANGNVKGNLNLRTVDIIGDSAARKFNPDWAIQWGYGIVASATNTTGQYIVRTNDVNMSVDYQGITNFSVNSIMLLKNTNIYFTGSHLESLKYLACASVSSGSNSVTVHNISTNHFSWYYCVSPICNKRYTVIISDGVNTYTTTMLTIVNDSVCLMSTNAANTFTLADIHPENTQNLSQGEGHAIYFHHDINSIFDGVKTYGCNLLNEQCYSAGGLTGEAAYHYYYNCGGYSYLGYGPGNGWLYAHQDSSDVIFRDCDSMYLYSLAQPIKFRAWNSNFGQAYCYNRDTFYNCTGNIEGGPGANVTIIGGMYNAVNLVDGSADTLRSYGGKIQAASNPNSTNGYFETNNTTLGIISGTIRQYPIEKDTSTWDATKKNLKDSVKYKLFLAYKSNDTLYGLCDTGKIFLAKDPATGGIGTVTSVGLSLPSGELNVTGSPVTTIGTLAATWVSQSANKVFAGPTSGGSATPSFRLLVAADIPDISSTYVSIAKYIVRETPGGSINSSNTAFTIANTPVSGTEQIYLNGLLEAVTDDYTISGANITMTNAPATGDKLVVTYLKL